MTPNARHEDILPGGVRSTLPPAFRIVRGQGGRVWDDGGNVYTDLTMGYGAVSIGHGEPSVVEAIASQAARGTLFPGFARELDALLLRLRELFPHTSAASLHKTGSEAVAAALRIARWKTGRPLIVRCGFHGWHDEIIQSRRPWHGRHCERQSDAVVQTPGVRDGSAPLEWVDGDPETLAAILQGCRGNIAAVLLDPVQIRSEIKDILVRVKDMCRNAGTLLVLDELKTCPRVALGGVQQIFGVQADLTIVGKGLANGFPFAAVLGPDYVNTARSESRIMGTFNGDLAAMAAVLATVDILAEEDAPGRFAALGTALVIRTNELLRERRMVRLGELSAEPWPCMPQFCLQIPDVALAALPLKVAKHGACVLTQHMNFVALRHTNDDMARAAQAIVDALSEDAAGGA